MIVPPISTPSPLIPTEITAPASRPASAAPFSDLVANVLQDAGQQQTRMRDTIRDFAAGDISSIHDVVTATANAELAFRMVLELRNRLVSAYQEVMRMQV